jgi:uncharacterized protein YigE (DUF2233 family)
MDNFVSLQSLDRRRHSFLWHAVGATLLALPLVGYGVLHWLRPPLTAETRSLFQGIDYERQILTAPRAVVIHILKIDLKAPGIQVFVTPGNPPPDQEATIARTTSAALTEFKLQLAVNANFFHPFREEAPWDYAPHSGDRVNPIGQTIANGIPYVQPRSDWPTLCFAANRQAQIVRSGVCPVGTQQAVAGNEILIAQGKLNPKLPPVDQDKPYARVAVAVDKTGEKLWIILVDGKQRFYSEGLKNVELAEVMAKLGVDTALNLDGGGSTTLVMATPTGPRVMNAPIQNKIPMNERPVANHLGFYAKELK